MGRFQGCKPLHVRSLRGAPATPPKPSDDSDSDLGSGPLFHQADVLSRITEGSNEAGSEVTFFSAVSGLTVDKAKERILPSPQRASTGSRKALEGSALRGMVRSFVETAVRGYRVEALRRDGLAQPVIFRLSRKVDAFELVPCAGGAPCVVSLTEVVSVLVGSDPGVQTDLGELLPSLDANCAVLDLADGRSLALRFAGKADAAAGPAAEASAFALCMQSFANELQRQ
mmetsp:Transcript_100063/g.177544  ORF Transcript_100063/g.177544 Transcript_100063/m.177544 type:complete len:228 (-) Transcript_100063:34-717(-)